MQKWLAPAVDYVSRWMEFQMHVSEQPGCVLAIAHKNRMVLEQAFGHADLARGIPLTPLLLLIVLAGFGSSLTVAADFTVAQVREQLAASGSDRPADFSGKDLSDLDLSKLDFKYAKLVGTNLFGARLVSSSFVGADLTRANLNGAWLMGTNFSGATLIDSSLMSVVVLGGENKTRPNFAGADLSGARIIADLPGANLSHARLHKANLGVDIKNQGMGQMRTDLTGANLMGADLSGADLNRSLLSFANLTNANLSGAQLYRAQLVGADLTGAEVTNADFTEADLDGTLFKGAKHLNAAKGMDKAANREKALF